MTDATTAKAILRVLAERWPDHEHLEKLEIDDTDGAGLVVRLRTRHVERATGWKGGVASDLRYRLSEAVPGRNVALQVHSEGPDRPQRGANGEEPALAAAEEPAPAAGEQGTGAVPDLLGQTVADARGQAWSAGFRLSTGDPDGTPISYYASYGFWVVAGQDPSPGVRAPRQSEIVVDVEERGGGDAGDREPRRPGPSGGRARLERSFAGDEGGGGDGDGD